ncbi:MAG TPA: hypothetical protein VK524_34035 [Polyangiaceae bacterium]|nr:hypothetical protein [Polyangiaceae bacterium]
MRARKILRIAVMLCLFVPMALALAGCQGGANAPKLAHVKPGDMPEGGDWSGVYYSQLYGYLHLVSQGGSASGAWRTTAGDAWGEMSGKITGDVFRFEWRERKIGMVGANAERFGKGYFRYLIPKEGEAHEIHGEWGLKSDEAGNEWKAVKQMNMQANPKGVKPDELEGRGVGGGWDDGDKRPPDTDAPAPSSDDKKGGDSSGDWP